MRRLRLRPKARNDLDKIWAFTFEYWGQAQAVIYVERIKHTLDLIARNPDIGQPREKTMAGLQTITVEKHTICYLVDDHQVDVLRILHRRMDLESHISRPELDLTIRH